MKAAGKWVLEVISARGVRCCLLTFSAYVVGGCRSGKLECSKGIRVMVTRSTANELVLGGLKESRVIWTCPIPTLYNQGALSQAGRICTTGVALFWVPLLTRVYFLAGDDRRPIASAVCQVW